MVIFQYQPPFRSNTSTLKFGLHIDEKIPLLHLGVECMISGSNSKKIYNKTQNLGGLNQLPNLSQLTFDLWKKFNDFNIYMKLTLIHPHLPLLHIITLLHATLQPFGLTKTKKLRNFAKHIEA